MKSTSPSATTDPENGLATRHLVGTSAAFSAFLMLSWLIPDVVMTPMIFPLSNIGSEQLQTALISLAGPVVGTICLLILLIPPLRRLSPWPHAVLGIGTLLATTLAREPATPLSGPIVAAISIAGAGLAVALFARPRLGVFAGYLALAAFPLVLLVFTLSGSLSGELNSAFLTPYREALCLLAMTGLAACGVSRWWLTRSA